MQPITLIRAHFPVSIAYLLLSGLTVVPADAQAGLGLSPMHVQLNMSPNVPHTDSLQLESQAHELTHVKGEVLDFSIDEDGNPQFEVDPKSIDSCRTFLRVNSRDFDLGVGQQQTIRYTFSPPPTLKNGSYHCAIAFTSEVPPGDQKPGMTVNVRVVTAFYIVVGNPTYLDEVKALSLQTDPVSTTKALRAFCILKNAGEYTWRPSGGLDLVAVDGSVRVHVPLRSLPVFPNHEQRFLLPLEVPPREGDTLRLRMDIGNGEVEEAHAVVSARMLAP